MKYLNIKNSLIKLKPIFSVKDIELAGFKVFPYQLSKWAKDGYIQSLGAGAYLFSEAKVAPEFIANRLRQPSYISLEYALYYYNLTVDISFHVTSVTTKGTKNITIGDKTFFYHHIKPTVFDGFIVKETGSHENAGQRFYIATPEKALADLFYLKPNRLKNADDFREARFHEEEMKNTFDWRGIFNLASLYKNNSLEKRLQNFKDYIFSS
jgi:predicted transcriptional regulator of viral defense system